MPAGPEVCESSPVTATLLVVDDHDGFRAVATALAASAGLDVVGEAGDGATAIALCDKLRPDAVLLDVLLPDADGFEIRRRLLARPDAPAVLLTSTRSRRSFGARLVDPDPIPFMPKDELSIDALRDLVSSR